jgi:probable O-glycosylation ligase (exosortase A-associated)
MRDLLFLVGFLATAPWALYYPHIGVVMWAWTSLIVHNAYAYGWATVIPFNKIVAVITLVIFAVSSEPKRLPRNITLWLLLIYGVWGCVSAATSISKEPQVMDYLERMLKSLTFCFMVVFIMNSKERIEALLYGIYLSLGFHGVVEGAKFLASGGSRHISGPGMSIISDNNHFALAMVAVLPIVVYLYRQTTSKALKVALAGSSGLVATAVMGTFSRGGLIGILAVTGLAFLRSRRKARFAAVLLPLLVAAVAFAPRSWSDRMDTIKTAEEDTSFIGRVIAWKQSTIIALDNPIFGGGFHAVQDYKVWMDARNKFSKLDFIETPEPDPTQAWAAHSIYFEVLGDLGFGGLLIFVLILVTSWRNASAVMRLAKERLEFKWASDLALSLQYSLLAYIVSGAALSLAYFDYSFMVFALLVALRGIVTKPRPQQPSPYA